MPTTTVMPTTAAPTTTIAPTTAAPTTTIAPTTAAPTTTSTTPEPCWSVVVFPELPDCFSCIAESALKPQDNKVEYYENCKDCSDDFKVVQDKCSMPTCFFQDISCCAALEDLKSKILENEILIASLQSSIQSLEILISNYFKGFEFLGIYEKYFLDSSGNYLGKNDVINNFETKSNDIQGYINDIDDKINKTNDPIKKNKLEQTKNDYKSALQEYNGILTNLNSNDGDSIFNSYINKFNQVNPYVQDLKTKRNELQNITNSNLFLNEKLPESNLYCLVENDDNSSLDPFLKSDNKQVFADYARNKIRA